MQAFNGLVGAVGLNQPSARVARGARRRLARAVASASTPVGIELLEDRRMMSVAINGSVTLDE
jgi:hypothetical protein